MVLTPLEWVMMGAWGLQTLSAAVSAMPKPKREGVYSFFYIFLHQITNSLDAAFEKKFGIVMPRVVDESAKQTVTTPESKIETAVSKTTTTTS